MANYTITGTDTLTLEKVKRHLNVEFTEDDDYITTLIDVSLSAVESYCRNVFLERSYTQNLFEKNEPTTIPNVLTSDLTTKPSEFVEVLYFEGGVEKTVSVPPLTQYTQSDNHYVYINNYIVVSIVETYDVDANTVVSMKWKTGMTEIDQAINQARLLLCGTYYENRESVAVGSVAELPTGTKYLLEPYSYPQVG